VRGGEGVGRVGEGLTPEAERLLGKFEVLAGAPGGVKRLRGLVLELAVRGRLIQQTSTDGAVSVLGQVEETDPFSIPRSWVWTPIERICADSFYGPRFSKEDYVGRDGVPTIRTTDMRSDGSISLCDAPRIRLTAEKLALYRVIDGDLLVTRSGSIGTMAVFRGEHDAIPSAYLIRFRFESSALPEYVCTILRSPYGLRVMGLGVTGSAQPNLNATAIRAILIPLPPLPEQRRIVAKVDDLMKLCDDLEARQTKQRETASRLNKAALAALTSAEGPEELAESWRRVTGSFEGLIHTPESVGELRKAVLELAVRGRLVPQVPGEEPAAYLLARLREQDSLKIRKTRGREPRELLPVSSDEAPYEVPSSWQWARFVEVATIESCLVDPSDLGHMPHVAPDNIEKGTGRLLPFRTIAEDAVTSGKHRFYAGHLLYSKIRPNLSKIVLVDFDGLCSADMYPLAAKVDSRFLQTFILSVGFLRQVVKEDNRIAMPKVNQEQLNETVVAVPPLAEQHRIVAKVDALMALCDTLEAALRRSEDTAQKLADALVAELLA